MKSLFLTIFVSHLIVVSSAFASTREWSEQVTCINNSGKRTVVDVKSQYASHGFYENVYQLVVRDTNLINYLENQNILVGYKNAKDEIVVHLGNSNFTRFIEGNAGVSGIKDEDGRYLLQSYVGGKDPNESYRIVMYLDKLPDIRIMVYSIQPPTFTIVGFKGSYDLHNCSMQEKP